MIHSLYLSVISEAGLGDRMWYTVLDNIILIIYSNTAHLLQHQRVSHIMVWGEAVKIVEKWDIYLAIILGHSDTQPDIYDITILINSGEEVSAQLHAQGMYYPDILADLFVLIQTYFNEILYKVFIRYLMVLCTQLANLVQNLTTRHL